MTDQGQEEVYFPCNDIGREEELPCCPELQLEAGLADGEAIWSVHVGVQTGCLDEPRPPSVSVEVQTTLSKVHQIYTTQDFTDDMFLHFTGLESYEKFLLVLNCLGYNHSLKYYSDVTPTISVEDQFLLTLMKLRTHKSNQELGILFKQDTKQVNSIFITWVNFMYRQLKRLKMWPSRQLVQFHTLPGFRSKFPPTRCILGVVEFPIRKPPQPEIHQATFSVDKKRNFMKVLVGASPGGLVTYVSPAYGWATTVRQIVERSDLPQKCDPGDGIVTETDFGIEDLFTPYKVSVNVPESDNRKHGGESSQWTIIELQGDLETKSQAASLNGKFVGDLHFSPKGEPVLIIGHHILYGKMVTMDRPMIALRKERSQSSHEDHMDTDDSLDGETEYLVKAIIEKKLVFKTRPKPIIANVPKKI